ncbi:amino acid permease [candidate division CSSED10-310 bacterium]|uniref:Amino acid permease n=1 Tax=candidate division CSSED10-310 bacterium TaxID=2855610 RepID=A0ABV6Z2C3_UNCC1
MTKDVSGSGTAQIQKFGTFLGVFTPSVLTILGLIMYLRFGWVVGNVGLPLTLFIVLVASAITFITALSASAIATNMKVGVGGEYFLISRSLGLELGGAIGIPLFLCRTLSITFYSFGLAESVITFWPSAWGEVTPFTIQAIAAVVIVIITAVSGKSAGLALKLQIPIMMAVGLSILALAIGVFSGEFRTPEMVATYRTAPRGFWYVFAVFFPAVTGFTAGIGMSGDLKNPQRSIPRGTILAVATGTVIYIFILVCLAMTSRISFEQLAEPSIAWIPIAILGPWLIYPGIWGAILSSAFGSVLGGPRVLQALAKDGLAPSFLARLSKTGQPTVATWISGAIALSAVSLGELNAVAQFVTILFLTLYVTINFSAALEKLVGDPSYRPTISVPWYVAILGSFGAGMVMFLISPTACVIAIILEFAIYFYLRRKAMQKRWGDVRAGMWVALARFALLKLRGHDIDPRNWRPHILLFIGDTAKRIGLVRLASWFNQNRGIITACQVVVGDLHQNDVDIARKRQEMSQTLTDEGLIAFSEVNVVTDYENGIIDIAQANGIARLRSNTVMFGWPKKKERLESILRIMRALSNAGKSTIIANLQWAHEPGQEKRIDIWWGGLQNNGDLMLLLAYLLRLNQEWITAKIMVRSIVETEEERKKMETGLAELVPSFRIQAETEVILKPEDQSVMDVMPKYSKNADIVFLGLMEPEPGTEAEYAERLYDLANKFNTTIFIRNAGELAGHLI